MRLFLVVVALAGLFVSAVWAVDVAVPVPVDTSNLVLTIPVSQPVNQTFKDQAGVTWELTGTLSGTLTARPKPQQMSEVPTQTGPQIVGYLDQNGQRIGGDNEGNPVGYGVVGKPVAILGQAFGTVPGQVLWGGSLPCDVLAWEDALIRFKVPPGTDPELGGTVRRSTVGVRTAAGQWATSLAFVRRAE